MKIRSGAGRAQAFMAFGQSRRTGRIFIRKGTVFWIMPAGCGCRSILRVLSKTAGINAQQSKVCGVGFDTSSDLFLSFDRSQCPREAFASGQKSSPAAFAGSWQKRRSAMPLSHTDKTAEVILLVYFRKRVMGQVPAVIIAPLRRQ